MDINPDNVIFEPMTNQEGGWSFLNIHQGCTIQIKWTTYMAGYRHSFKSHVANQYTQMPRRYKCDKLTT